MFASDPGPAVSEAMTSGAGCLTTRIATGVAVRVRVPGSSANLGPGFDSIGLALGMWDQYVAEVTQAPGLVIELGEESSTVPTDERHLVYATMVRALAELHVAVPAGVVLRCRNTLPQGRGLGSSAAAIVAGVALALALVEASSDDAPVSGPLALDRTFVNDLASALEGHPDNASASVYGGMTLSWVDSGSGSVHRSLLRRVHSESIPLHADVEPVVFVPSTTLATATARAVLPAQVPHRDAALNSARAGLLVLAASARPDLLLPATREWLHQEQRRTSLGGAMEVVDALRAAGHGAVISGAGPSVLVLATRQSADAAATQVPQGWSVHRPGVPVSGVTAERVTLDTLHGSLIGA